jgi:hypothetical protein
MERKRPLNENKKGASINQEIFRKLLVAQIRFHSGDVLLDDIKFALDPLPRYLRAGDST